MDDNWIWALAGVILGWGLCLLTIKLIQERR